MEHNLQSLKLGVDAMPARRRTLCGKGDVVPPRVSTTVTVIKEDGLGLCEPLVCKPPANLVWLLSSTFSPRRSRKSSKALLPVSMAHDVCHQYTCILIGRVGAEEADGHNKLQQQKAKQRTIAVDLVLGGLSRPGIKYTNLEPLVPHPVIGRQSIRSERNETAWAIALEPAASGKHAPQNGVGDTDLSSKWARSLAMALSETGTRGTFSRLRAS